MRPAQLLLPLIYVGFVSLGLPDGAFGVAWPAMHRDLGLPIGFAGLVVVIVTGCSALSGFNSGAVIGRFKTGPVVLTSCALTGIALVMLAHVHHVAWLLLAALPLGLGAGAVDAGLNGYVARHYRGRHMSWLHACWGIGATLGPIVIARAVAHADWRAGYSWIATAQLALAALFFFTLRLWSRVPERDGAPVANSGTGTPHRPLATANSTAGWLSAAIFTVYVAIEGTTGVWASSILIESRGFAHAAAGLCAAAFYGSITVGRILAGFIVEHWGNRRTVSVGAALAFLGATGFVFATNVPTAAVSLAVLGLGFAPMYPCLMHEVPRRFAPEAVQTVIGRQSGAGNLGGAVLPSAAGWLAQFSLESITWVIAVGIIALALAVRQLNRMT